MSSLLHNRPSRPPLPIFTLPPAVAAEAAALAKKTHFPSLAGVGEESDFPAVAGLWGVEPPEVRQIVEIGEGEVLRGRVVQLRLWGWAAVPAGWSVEGGWGETEEEEEEAVVHLLESGGGQEVRLGVR